MALGPGRGIVLRFNAKEAVGIEPNAAGAQNVNGMKRIADHHLRRGKGWIEPVERRLAFLEVMQIHPAPGHAVHAKDDIGGAPVGFLNARLEKDHAAQLPHDIALFL